MTKMHRLGESALKEAWRSSGVMSSLELTLTVGKDTAVLGPDIVRGILEEEVDVFNCCGQGQVGFSGEKSVNVEDGGEDD